MVFSIDDYVDDQFLSYQRDIVNVSSIPALDLVNIKNEKQFIKALVSQNKAYAKKILDLFEELLNEVSGNGLKAQKELLNTSKSSAEQGSTPKTNPRSATKPEGDGTNREAPDISHLEGKIEYLNSLYMETKQQCDEKDEILVALRQQNEELAAEKERLDSDLQDLMEEFAHVKQIYESQTNILKEKERIIADLKKKTGSKETPMKPVVEHEKIPELNEEIEELKEKLEHKEKLIIELRTELDSIVAVDRQQVNEFETLYKCKDDELSILQTKIFDLGSMLWNLRTAVQNLCVKSKISVMDKGLMRTQMREEEKLSTEELENILDNEHFVIVDTIVKMVDDLSKQPPKQVVVTKTETSGKASPGKVSVGKSRKFKEYLAQINEEIKEKARVSLETLAKENYDELVAQLEEEIEKNQQLKDKIEELSYALQKLTLSVQEDLDRLSLVHEYARKSTSTEEFRTQINACRSRIGELVRSETIEKLDLNEEYEKQRVLWQEKIDQQAARFKEDLSRLQGEIENQKLVTLKQEQEFKEQLSALRKEYEASKKEYAEESYQYEERITYLEQEKDNLNRYIEEIKKNKAEVENILSEREETILNYSKSIAEWQAKCSYLETDIRKALNEKTKMQDLVFEKDSEIEGLKENRSELQNKVRLLSTNVETLEKNQRRNTDEINHKTIRIEELEKIYEDDKAKWAEMNDQLKLEYREYVEDTEKATEQLKENYEHLIEEYNTQLEDLRKYTEQQKKAHENQLAAQFEEINRLTQMNEEIASRARNQVDTMRAKDEKIGRVNEEFRNLEFKVRTLEDSLIEMNTIKEKNKRYFELLTNNNLELNTLKVELQGLANERNDALEKANKIEKAYIEIREELRKSIEKNERSKESIQEHQAEIKALKDELDKSHRKLLEKEKEIKNMNEDHLNQSRTTIGYKDETISRLKSDLRQVTNDYENLRREYQEIIEKNEETLFENEKLKQIVFDKDLTFNEIEKLNNLNDELLIQSEQLKADKRRLEEEFDREKRNLVLEINGLKSKNLDLQANIQKRK